MKEFTQSAPTTRDEPALDATMIHGAHADFVYLTLQRFGVREADLEDMLQEVFVVVHQRIHTFDGSAQVTTWLYGICMRVASGYRRRGYNKHENDAADVATSTHESRAESPEEAAQIQQDRAVLYAILNELELDKRSIFVMFEMDEMSCEEIAGILDVPVGTVYSRLHAARKSFSQALARRVARDARKGTR